MNWQADAEAHAKREYPRESCGLIVVDRGRERYIPCRNLASGTEHFILDPLDYALAEERGQIVGIVHSHPDASANPSEADRVACEASKLPWHIVGWPTAVWRNLEPSGYSAPLIGREFSHGVLDCYALIRDFYSQELSILLPDFDRRDDWWRNGENLYVDNFAKAGFSRVESPKQNDVILMQILSPVANHGGVFFEDNTILHHLHGRLSSRDVYGGYFRMVTTHVLRHKMLL